ncbi:MAG: PAC2 family protein [Ilumatobacteraceae bacterium]
MTPLTTAFDDLAPLHRPIMVLALRGLFDIAEVATDAVDELIGDNPAPIVAAIDADPFFDFTQERPVVEFADDERVVRWPENEFRIIRHHGGAHDLVVLAGVEPHLRYATFADCIIEVATRLGCEAVITVGAAPDSVPHTRPPLVVGSTTNRSLGRALGLSRPQYQGVTGLVGVLQTRLDEAGLPAVSLRVGVPAYLGNAKHPQSSAALLRHLEHVLGIPIDASELDEQARGWRTVHDEAVDEDPDAQAHVARLEREYDRMLEQQVPSGDDLAAEFEKFLRDERNED